MENENSTCVIITADFQDSRVGFVVLINFTFFIILLILFFFARFFLWSFGKRNIYRWQVNLKQFDYVNIENSIEEDKVSEELSSIIETAREHHFFNWIFNYFSFGLRELKERVGVDAYLYQVFQLHLLFLMVIITVICIVVVLSINVVICGVEKESVFAKTSIYACLRCSPTENDNYQLTWMHSIITHLLVLCGLGIGINFKRILVKYDIDYICSNTLQISNLKYPKEETSKISESIKKHFIETEGFTASDLKINFAYNISKFLSIHNKKNQVRQLEDTYRKLEVQYKIQQFLYLSWKKVICCFKPVRGSKNYSELAHKLEMEEKDERIYALKNPQNVAFVQFPKEVSVSNILRQYILWFKRPKSTVSSILNTSLWNIKNAPTPSDIIWENIRTSWPHLIIWYARWLIINLILIIIIIFFTTPASTLSAINFLLSGIISTDQPSDNSDSIQSILSTITRTLFSDSNNTAVTAVESIVLAYFTPLLQLLLASLIPLIAIYATYLEFHWTKSIQENASILKTFTFLLLMLLIFPSFSLSSVHLFIQRIIQTSDNTNNSLNEVKNITISPFLPSIGIFFINYLNTSAFLVIIQIFQIPSLILYLYRKLSARNAHELNKSQEAYTYTFKFGIEYAWVLVKVSIAIVYCTLFPLITISGTLYLIMKILVDRYNLIYQAKSSFETTDITRVNVNVHSRALYLFYLCLILAQYYILILSIFIYVTRTQNLALLIVNSMLVSISTLIFISGYVFIYLQKYSSCCGKLFSLCYKERNKSENIYDAYITYNYFDIIDQAEKRDIEIN